MNLAVHLFLQLSLIVLLCRISGRLLRRLGQTQVVSEMVAGIVIGPSVFGMLWPQAQQWLFPARQAVGAGAAAAQVLHPNMAVLYALSQLGLVLYMFLLGTELDLKLLAGNTRDTVAVSLSGILVPCAVGALLGVWMSADRRLFPESVSSWQCALFAASAMSITAFPMLARILQEFGITNTRMGTLAVGAAALDDAIAWVLLACVMASVESAPMVAVLAVGGATAYALVMPTLVRPMLRRFETSVQRNNGTSPETFGWTILILMLCAWFTDLIGIHSVFGAFICGLCMPRGRFVQELQKTVQPLTMTLLLPIFFVYSGLNTRLNLLLDPGLLGVALLVICAAFACKGGGCLLASRAVGATWREAAGIGILMNARGMMELILVNIAREKGLITDGLFTILVAMALATTLAASPLFACLFRRAAPHPAAEAASVAAES
jgi:Kef-type K+ transport system membrane component KefB